MAIDGICIVGFGGPTAGCCERLASCVFAENSGCEARCFVSGILGDNPAREKRIDEVTSHYMTLGGFSPYNELTEQQADSLQAELKQRGHDLPVACGYRHWAPWGRDALSDLYEQGCRSVALLIMAPHQSSVSWDWYIKYAAEEADKLGEASPEITAIVEPWWNQQGFIDGMCAELKNACDDLSQEEIDAAALIFTAHAIPQPVEATSPYRKQFAESAALTAQAFGHAEHQIAFQSAGDDSSIPWSSPDICSSIRDLHANGCKRVIIQAAGFLVDHTEVIYDLDHEAQTLCNELGVDYIRAACVHDQPAFISCLADQVVNSVSACV
ncbi:MAG: ferrochelatase [Planctomycetes bacterium]|nr:ferrochelatase [Planctomycetota bacterium]